MFKLQLIPTLVLSLAIITLSACSHDSISRTVNSGTPSPKPSPSNTTNPSPSGTTHPSPTNTTNTSPTSTTHPSAVDTKTVPQWIAAKVAKSLGKEVNDLTDADWTKIPSLELDFSDMLKSEREKSDAVDLSCLIKMKNLTRLTINHIHAKNFSFLTQLPNLMILRIQDTGMDSLPDLSGLTHLLTLELVNGGLKNTDFVRNLKNLKILNLSQNPLSDLTPLQLLPKLEVLEIQQTDVKTIQPILSMKPLKILTVSQNKIYDLDQLKTHKEIHVIERQTEAANSGIKGTSDSANVELTDDEAEDILKKLIPKATDIAEGMFNGSDWFKYDTNKTIPGGKDYCLVTGERWMTEIDTSNVKSIADLKKVVENVFTKESAQKLFYSRYLETKDIGLPLYKDYKGQLYVNTHNGGHGWSTTFLYDTAKIISQKDHVVQVALATTVLDDPEGILDIKMKNVNGKWFMESGLDDYEYIINGTVK